MDTNIENNSFLLLSAHRNKYFEEFSKKLDKDNKNYQGFILEDLFFSESNIEIVQKQLVLSIFKQSNRKYLIPFQNYKSILTVMKFIFNDQAKHLPYDITNQIKELNTKVVQELTPMIIKNIDSKLKYLDDINSPPPVNDLPINVNSAGNKTLPSISYTFN
tara:strand:- start:789 stop:1271 length:483 start_codon:yes stop_codon:yes gene_type:complete